MDVIFCLTHGQWSGQGLYFVDFDLGVTSWCRDVPIVSDLQFHRWGGTTKSKPLWFWRFGDHQNPPKWSHQFITHPAPSLAPLSSLRCRQTNLTYVTREQNHTGQIWHKGEAAVYTKRREGRAAEGEGRLHAPRSPLLLSSAGVACCVMPRARGFLKMQRWKLETVFCSGAITFP